MKKNIILFNLYFSFYFFQNLMNFDIDSFRVNAVTFYITGNPDPLVFHAPQFFFECLQQRISAGNKKKRLPNFTTVFMRKDALPLGTFTKYTWHITNILHVKQIFDTQEVSATQQEVAGLRGTVGSLSN